jgi:hypothetical protein
MNANPPGLPLAYFITFSTYGSWLHGEEKGSVDRAHNLPGTPYLEADAGTCSPPCAKSVPRGNETSSRPTCARLTSISCWRQETHPKK